MENGRYIKNSILNELIRYETMKFFEEKAKGFSEQDFLDALKEIPNIPPDDIDKLDTDDLKIKA